MPADGRPLVVVAVPPHALDAAPLLAATLRRAAAAPQRAGRVVVCSLLRIREQERASDRQPPCSYDSAKARVAAAQASMMVSRELSDALAAGSGPAAVVVIDDWANTGITMEAAGRCIFAAAAARCLAHPRLITATLCATKAFYELGDALPEAPEALRREAEALVLRRPDVGRFVELVKSAFGKGTFGGDEADDSYMVLIVGALSEGALQLALRLDAAPDAPPEAHPRLADWSTVLPAAPPRASGVYVRVETQTLAAAVAAAATQAARGEMDVSNAAAAALAHRLMEAGWPLQSLLERDYVGLTSVTYEERFASEDGPSGHGLLLHAGPLISYEMISMDALKVIAALSGGAVSVRTLLYMAEMVGEAAVRSNYRFGGYNIARTGRQFSCGPVGDLCSEVSSVVLDLERHLRDEQPALSAALVSGLSTRALRAVVRAQPLVWLAARVPSVVDEVTALVGPEKVAQVTIGVALAYLNRDRARLSMVRFQHAAPAAPSAAALTKCRT